MYPKFFVAALLAFVVPFAAASPNPVPTPVAEEQQLQVRQGPSDVFNSLTSAAASAITGDGGSILSQATSVLGSAGSEVTSFAGSVGSQVTSAAGGVFTTVTSVGGQALTVVTSVGGQGLTLAGSGAGVATSAFGSLYTVATAAAQNSNNAALGLHAVGLSSPAVVGLVTVMGSALLGAVITL